MLEWLRGAGGLGRITWPIRLNLVARLPEKPEPTPKPKGATGPAKEGDVAFVWVNGLEEGWGDGIAGELQEIKGDDLANREVYADLKGVDALSRRSSSTRSSLVGRPISGASPSVRLTRR